MADAADDRSGRIYIPAQIRSEIEKTELTRSKKVIRIVEDEQAPEGQQVELIHHKNSKVMELRPLKPRLPSLQVRGVPESGSHAYFLPLLWAGTGFVLAIFFVSVPSF